MNDETTSDTDRPATDEPGAAVPLDRDPDKGSYRMLMALVAMLLIGLVVAVVVLRDSGSSEATDTTTSAPAGVAGREPKVIMPDQEPGPVTPFTVTTFDGQTRDSDSFRGTPLVINFWASWCGPCRKEMPAFQQVADELAGKVTVLGIASDDGESDARRFAAERGIRYPLAMEPEDLADDMGVFGLPSTFLVDADGNVVEAHYGELSHAQLTTLIREELGVSST